MTKEQAKKVIEMVYKDKPIDKDGLFEIIDMIDGPSIQYYPSYPYTFPEKPQEWPWNIPCYTSNTSNKATIGSASETPIRDFMVNPSIGSSHKEDT